MNAHPLLMELQLHRVQLERHGDRIRMQAPEPPPADLIAKLRANKAAILPLLPDKDARPVVNFRLPDHPPNAWATAVGRPGETVAALVTDLRERWPDAEIGP